MSLSTPQLEQLKTQLEAQIAAIDSYTTQLDEVKQALTGTDPELIAQRVAQATELFQALEESSSRCLQLLPEMGYAAAPDGLEKLVEDAADTALSQLKSELEEKVSALKHAIMVNDQLIRKSQNRVRQSIRVLTGHSPAGDGDTYDAGGAARAPSSTQRILARV